MTGAGVRAAASAALRFAGQRGLLPQTLVFFVTSRCPARCDFCLYARRVSAPTPSSEELTAREVERIAARYGRLRYLTLSGGEPFLRDDLDALCQSFIDRCGTAVVNIPSILACPDTALATLERLAARNPRVVFELQLSIDGVGEAHDASRKLPGLYERAVRGARRYGDLCRRHRNLRLKASILWLDSTKAETTRVAEALSREAPFDRIQLGFPNRLLPQSGAADEEALADFRAFLTAARRLPAPRAGRVDCYTAGMRAVQSVYHDLLGRALDGTLPVGRYCEAGRRIAVLDETGEVFGCEPLWESVGNVRSQDYDMGRVLRGAACARFRTDRLGARGCNCTWSCAILTGIANSPRHLPRLCVKAAGIWTGALRR